MIAPHSDAASTAHLFWQTTLPTGDAIKFLGVSASPAHIRIDVERPGRPFAVGLSSHEGRRLARDIEDALAWLDARQDAAMLTTITYAGGDSLRVATDGGAVAFSVSRQDGTHALTLDPATARETVRVMTDAAHWLAHRGG